MSRLGDNESRGEAGSYIFVTDFTAASKLFLPAAAIGMLPTDNVDALDVEIGVPQIHGGPGPPTVPALSPPGLGSLVGLISGVSFWIFRRASTRVEGEAID